MTSCKTIGRFFIGGVAALAVVAGAASGTPGLDKEEACAYIDCAGGKRDCGTVSGTVPAGGPFTGDEIKVTYTCYEPIPN